MLLYAYRKLQEWIYYVCAIVLGLMMVIIFVQVITRYVFFYSLTWSEELCRFFFIWIIFIGCSIGVRENIEMKIDLLEILIPYKPKKVLRYFQNIIALVTVFVVVINSYNFLEIGKRSVSPILLIPMNYVYIGQIIGFVMVGVELIVKLAQPFIHATKIVDSVAEKRKMRDES